MVKWRVYARINSNFSRPMAMVRFARFVSLIVVAILLGSNASAEPTTAQYVRMFNQPADIGLFSRVSGAAPCRHGGCAAVHDLALAEEAVIESHNTYSPMWYHGPVPSQEHIEKVVRGKIKRLLLSHPRHPHFSPRRRPHPRNDAAAGRVLSSLRP